MRDVTISPQRARASTAERVVRDEAYAELTAMILRNDIPPASRINIDALAVRLGVSATPVREALARLESDGLVVKTHLRGYRTTDLLTQREVADLWDFRLRIEPYAAARVAESVTSEQARALRDEIDSLPAAPSGTGFDSYKEFSAHDERLHTAILAMAGNAVTLRAFERTHCHLHAFRLAYDAQAGHETIEEHRLVVDAIARGDAVEASHRMAAHLEASRDRLLPLARPSEEGAAPVE